MHPTHRERLSQVSAESGLNFITNLNGPDLAQPSVSANQAAQRQPHLSSRPPPDSVTTSSTGRKPHLSTHHNPPTDPSAITGTSSFDLDGIDPILHRHGLLQPGDMIDFHGPTGSGKTHFLYAIIISTILPKFWRYSKSKQAIPMSGKARSVMFFDLDQGVSVERLKALLCLQIVDRVRQYQDSILNNNDTSTTATSTSTPASNDIDIDITSSGFLSKIDQLAQSCLRNVHIFRPPDTASLLVLLRTLDSFLLRHQQQASPPFTFLIIDSMSSFYWQDRAQTNHTRVMSLIYDALQRLVAPWGLVFLTTSWLLPSSSSTSMSVSAMTMDPTDRTLPESFRAKLRYRFLLQPRNLNRFESEQLLWREWLYRQRQLGQETATTSDLQQGGDRKNSETGMQSTATGIRPESLYEPRPSLFQGQMIIPEIQTQQHHGSLSSTTIVAQPELFRFSLSMKEGIFTFCPPPPPPPPPQGL